MANQNEVGNCPWGAQPQVTPLQYSSYTHGSKNSTGEKTERLQESEQKNYTHKIP